MLHDDLILKEALGNCININFFFELSFFFSYFGWLTHWDIHTHTQYTQSEEHHVMLTRENWTNILFYSHHDFALCVDKKIEAFFMGKDYPLIDFTTEVIPLVDDECCFCVVCVCVYTQIFSFFTIESKILWCVLLSHVRTWYVGVSGT